MLLMFILLKERPLILVAVFHMMLNIKSSENPFKSTVKIQNSSIPI